MKKDDFNPNGAIRNWVYVWKNGYISAGTILWKKDKIHALLEYPNGERVWCTLRTEKRILSYIYGKSYWHPDSEQYLDWPD